MSRVLLDKLAAVRQKHAWVAATSGAALAVAVLVAALGVGMLMDWWLDLPWVVRAFLLASYLGVAGWIVARRVVLPIVQAPDVETLALRVERAEPVFRSRLIASVQLGGAGALAAGMSPGLVAALVRQTEQFAQSVDFRRVVKTDRLLRLVAIASGLLLALSAAMALGGQTASDLLRRALLSNIPVPRHTRVECTSGNVRVARGDSVTLAAIAHGIVPDSGYAVATFESNVVQNFTLDADPVQAGRFSRVLENAQESFTYVVHLHDGYSESYSVTVAVRPAATSVECLSHYPAYINKPPEKKVLGDLALLSGSRLGLAITANKPVKVPTAGDTLVSRVHLHGSNKDVPLAVDAADHTTLSGLISLPPLTSGISIHLVDPDGVESKDPAVYRIELIPDKPPTVRVTYPAEHEQLATKAATVVIGFDAADDFALGRLDLFYKRDDGAAKSIPLNLEGTPASRRGRFEWRLATVAPREGSVLEYWLEVQDTNNVTGPGRGASEHYRVKIVNEAEKRAELTSRVDKSLRQINNVSEGEQEANERLGTLILEKPGSPQEK